MDARTTETIRFRVHHDGGHADITATSSEHARQVFKETYPKVIITKIKVVRD